MIKKLLFGTLAFLSLTCGNNPFEPERIRNNVNDSLEVIVKDSTKTPYTPKDTSGNKTPQDTTTYEPSDPDTIPFEPENPDTTIYEPSEPDTIKIVTTPQNNLVLNLSISKEPPYLNFNAKMQNTSGRNIEIDNLNVHNGNPSVLEYVLLDDKADTLFFRNTTIPFYLKVYENGYLQVSTKKDTTFYKFSDCFLETRSEKWGEKKVNIPYPLTLTKRDISDNSFPNVNDAKYHIVRMRYELNGKQEEAVWVKELK